MNLHNNEVGRKVSDQKMGLYHHVVNLAKDLTSETKTKAAVE